MVPLHKLQDLPATLENWNVILAYAAEQLDAGLAQDEWVQLVQAVANFPLSLCDASRLEHHLRAARYLQLLQLCKQYRIHRSSNAPLQAFCNTPHTMNIQRIAFDYRDSDDSYAPIELLFRSRHFPKLRKLRIKMYYMQSHQIDALLTNLDNFPALKQIDVLGYEPEYRERALPTLQARAIACTLSANWGTFTRAGYDFWK